MTTTEALEMFKGQVINAELAKIYFPDLEEEEE